MPLVTQEQLIRPVLPRRYDVLDTLRGFALVGMVLYHLCYNLHYIFGISLPWFESAGAQAWQISISSLFLLLAGVCTHLTHKPFRRAFKVGGAALLISLVTWLFMPGELVVFGILHCMTWCMLFYAATKPLLRRIPTKPGLILCLALFALTYHVPQEYLFFKPFSIPLPHTWYMSYWLSIVGLLSTDFASADYFPIFPYLFLFLAGHFLGRWLHRLPNPARFFSIPPLSGLGRHSMAVYLLHQPVLYGVMQLFLG